MAKKRSFRGLIVLGFVVFAAVAAGYYVWGRDANKPPEITTTVVTRGDVIQSVTATGVLQAPTSVDISSQISGQIKEVLVDYNESVKKGDVLARLDAATYESRLRQAEATLASNTANHTLTRLSTERIRELRAKNLVSQQELDQAEAQLSQANAQLLQAKASVEDARVNLDRCTLYAPIDGIVLDRIAEVGKMVAASLNAPTLFTLVTNLTKMEISADVAEADVGVIAIGQDVTFTVDAYPSRQFQGRVAQIRNLPKTAQSVVVYATIIEVDNDNLRLKPGMTANVSIITARRAGALKIPNAALRVSRVPDEFLPAPAAGTPAAGAPADKAASADASKSDAPERRAAAGAGGGNRREQFRQLLQDAGVTFTPGQPLAPADIEKLKTLAAQRGIELPERLLAGGRNRQESETTTRTIYRVVSPMPNLKVEPVTARFGISDGSTTEVISGLQENDVLLTSIFVPGDNVATTRPGQNSNPLAGGGRRF